MPEEIKLSIVVPVYNRPDEVEELLISLKNQDCRDDFEVVIVEDGSTDHCEHICEQFKNDLNIAYFFKSNSGPGDSRNYGMQRSSGNYFILVDSDCVLPHYYFSEIFKELKNKPVDFFGGPDGADSNFTDLQKAISFTMTSWVTTGGIRGSKRTLTKFEPRSFNMGLSKRAFEASKGFSNIHPGEDPDLSIRLHQMGFQSRYFPEAVVFHKRRISLKSFYTQVYKFGSVRPILSQWHKESFRVTHLFPSLFVMALLTCMLMTLLSFKSGFLSREIIELNRVILGLISVYHIIVLVSSLVELKRFKLMLMALVAMWIQFCGYGYGYIRSSLYLKLSRKSPNEILPEFFFKEDESV